MKKIIAVITGGESTEREISLLSAKNIARILSGRNEVKIFVFPEEKEAFVQQRETIRVAIPVIHGKGGEDGEIQKLLSSQTIPFIFSSIEAHEIALQKDLAKERVRREGIRSPEGFVVCRGEKSSYPGYEVVVKPVDGGSSVATQVASSAQEYSKALEEGLRVSEKVLVERRIVGREFTVGVIERKGKLTALPVIEIVANSFFNYEQKYEKSKLAEEICPAEIEENLANKLKEIALNAHRVLGCRHISRTDIMMDEGKNPWFLEINTIPGFTANSLVPKMLKTEGISTEELFQEWIEESIP